MFYKANKTLIYATAAIALGSIGSAAMADVLVTRSSGAAARQYPRGTRLNENQVIVLGRGDSVTILTSRGTREYTRPGRYPLDGPLLLASNGPPTGRVRAGVSRGFDQPDSPWDIDVELSGPFCMAEGQAVRFWRAPAEEGDPSTYTVTRLADNSQVTITFGGADPSTVAWPEGFVPHNGTYAVHGVGSETTQEIVITSIAVDLSDPVAVGAALHENGCDTQLAALVYENRGDDDAS